VRAEASWQDPTPLLTPPALVFEPAAKRRLHGAFTAPGILLLNCDSEMRSDHFMDSPPTKVSVSAEDCLGNISGADRMPCVGYG
jgi:hypothetical protein